MGASSSSSDIKSVSDIYSENLFNLLSKSISSSSADCKTAQTNNITIGGNANCSINVEQDAIVICSLSSSVLDSSNIDLVSMMETAVEQTAESEQKSVQDMLSLSVSNTLSKQELLSKVKNSIKKNITNETISSCLGIVSMDQENNITINGDCNKDINVTQNLQLELIAQCLTEKISEIVSEDVITTEQTQSGKSTMETIQKGLSSLVSSFGMVIALAIIAGVLILIMIPIIKSLTNKSNETK